MVSGSGVPARAEVWGLLFDCGFWCFAADAIAVRGLDGIAAVSFGLRWQSRGISRAEECARCSGACLTSGREYAK